jgi:hypothetical protein
MKKQVLGVVVLALSIIPAVGAFATNPDPLTDTINLTVSQSCTLARKVSNSGSYVTSATTYSQSMDPNTLNDNFGTSMLRVICNNAAGFTVTADFSAFTGTGTSINYTSSTAPSAGSGTWTTVKGTSSATTMIATGSAVISATAVTSSSGKTQQVTYKVGTAPDQAKGSYSATATYTLTQN